jgi:hypothetical protein
MSATFRVGDRVKVVSYGSLGTESTNVGRTGTVSDTDSEYIFVNMDDVVADEPAEPFYADELELVAVAVNVPDEEPRTVRDLIDAWEAFDGDDVDDFFREWEPVFRPIPNDVERMFDMPSPEADALDRIAALVKGSDWTDHDESYCGYESAVTAIAAILRETGRL